MATRYPERCAVSWLHELRCGRWLFVLAMAGIGAVLAGTGLMAPRNALRQARAIELCAAQSEELELELLTGALSSSMRAGWRRFARR